jgi:hypothetical protein
MRITIVCAGKKLRRQTDNKWYNICNETEAWWFNLHGLLTLIYSCRASQARHSTNRYTSFNICIETEASSDPSPDPAQASATCTVLLFFKKTEVWWLNKHVAQKVQCCLLHTQLINIGFLSWPPGVIIFRWVPSSSGCSTNAPISQSSAFYKVCLEYCYFQQSINYILTCPAYYRHHLLLKCPSLSRNTRFSHTTVFLLPDDFPWINELRKWIMNIHDKNSCNDGVIMWHITNANSSKHNL